MWSLTATTGMAYFACYVTMIIYLRGVLKVVPFPITVTALGFAAGSLISVVVVHVLLPLADRALALMTASPGGRGPRRGSGSPGDVCHTNKPLSRIKRAVATGHDTQCEGGNNTETTGPGASGLSGGPVSACLARRSCPESFNPHRDSTEDQTFQDTAAMSVSRGEDTICRFSDCHTLSGEEQDEHSVNSLSSVMNMNSGCFPTQSVNNTVALPLEDFDDDFSKSPIRSARTQIGTRSPPGQRERAALDAIDHCHGPAMQPNAHGSPRLRTAPAALCTT